jgi:hypothetical protein
MWQRPFQIVVVCFLVLPGKIFSQQHPPLFAQKYPHIINYHTPSTSFHPAQPFTPPQNFFSFSKNYSPAVEIISADHYTNCLGFFCKKELQLEKFTALPLRFRLGSLEYVNRMEGKK